ncbi:MAG: 4-hydroxythreonine-4-phosphate dehydrogenase PdxA [Candidatus Omnitrophica bacterium]|nr:4-hydroxythreonine-4-phosphate dehydrogenase PdxA [Candidatus Omnitrophota bacterium]
MTNWIGIALGDPTGIGPEITLKALASTPGLPDGMRFLIIGDGGLLEELDRRLKTSLTLAPYQGPHGSGRLFYYNPLDKPLPLDLPPGSPAAARAAMSWLAEGARRCLRGELDALVTAPVNKEAIIRAGYAFVGQTEFLSQMAHADRTAMMLLGADDRGRWLRVALVTTHAPLREVPDRITTAKVEQVIELASEACGKLGLRRARVGVCGLNPHAGEGGKLGNEEIDIIAPAVLETRKRGIDVAGPLAADTLFYQAYHGNFDVVVAMYHDQGLGPLKMIGFDTGINWTLGLPFVRTSPDHGTAYDIAGQDKASPGSMQAAVRLARQLIHK